MDEKYIATVSIIDLNTGDQVYERDLSRSEIIEELLVQKPMQDATKAHPVEELEEIPEEEFSRGARDFVARDTRTFDEIKGEEKPAIDLNEDTIKAVLPETRFKKHVPDKPAAKKGVKACKHCGVPGHMQKTCPKKRLEDRALDEKHEDDIAMGRDLIEDVDEAVAEIPPASHEINSEKKGAMTGMEFMKVRTMKEDGFNSVQVAAAVRHNIREVNKAWGCTTHSEYIKNRERDV